MKRIDRLVW